MSDVPKVAARQICTRTISSAPPPLRCYSDARARCAVISRTIARIEQENITNHFTRHSNHPHRQPLRPNACSGASYEGDPCFWPRLASFSPHLDHHHRHPFLRWLEVSPGVLHIFSPRLNPCEVTTVVLPPRTAPATPLLPWPPCRRPLLVLVAAPDRLCWGGSG